MKLRTSMAALAAVFAVSATAIPAQSMSVPPCGFHDNLVGQSIDDIDLDALREKQRVRVIVPGQPVTSDHSETRLNLKLDKKGGTVLNVSCG